MTERMMAMEAMLIVSKKLLSLSVFAALVESG
jgi:hypothetical protein